MRGLVQIVFGLILGAVGALWAWPLRGMLAEVSTRILGDFAAQAPAGLMIAGGLYVLTGLLTMLFSGIAGIFAKGASKKAAAKQLDLFHELLTGATVRMVGADGQIAPPEMSMVSGVLDKFGQTPVPEKTIKSISEAFVKDPDRYINLMKSKSGELSDDQKSHIVRACLLVAMSDVAMTENELTYLKAVADALKISPQDLDKIKSDLTAVTQKLVSAAAFAA
jgi:uncharacterized tellurite resistance protein B-like protein